MLRDHIGSVPKHKGGGKLKNKMSAIMIEMYCLLFRSLSI